VSQTHSCLHEAVIYGKLTVIYGKNLVNDDYEIS